MNAAPWVQEGRRLLDRVPAWSETSQHRVVAVGLAGSWARVTARAQSDIDLVVLVPESRDQRALLADDAMFTSLGAVTRSETEDWGAIQSRRVFYECGLEVEFGIGLAAWAATKPVDPGTQRVVADGFRILWDPTGVLGALVSAVNSDT